MEMGNQVLCSGTANCNREFFQYQPPRPLHEIDREPATMKMRIMDLLRQVTE